jgi:hypothetical protein
MFPRLLSELGEKITYVMANSTIAIALAIG